MNTAIIYISKHGTTEKIVKMISKELKGKVDLINFAQNPLFDPSGYDRIIIGGSIYAGSISPKLKKFIKRNIETLYDKEIALFLVCMHDGDSARKQFEDNFPAPLRKKSVANGLFGGEIIISKLNLLEKVVMWKIQKKKQDVHQINQEEIEKFTKKLNKK